uniref:histidine kinase n=1 Tax=Geobacter metallireducens TaxID=28232 RepID=A0A831XDE2_GEOME
MWTVTPAWIGSVAGRRGGTIEGGVVSEEIRSVRVLYMEDDAGLARLLQRRLQRQGYSVDIAGNGDDGLVKLEQNNYDVVLVDYSMPSCDGIDVLRFIAERKTSPPVIMITGKGNEKVAVEALQLGASDYIVKDVEMGYLEFLPIVIEQVLQKQQLLREREEMLKTIQESEERYRKLTVHLEQIIRERTAELEASNRELESFCYSVSHDLHAPLRAISGYSKVLLEDCRDRLDDADRESLARIGTAAVRMGELIDSLLDLSRVATCELQREPVDLSAIAREAAQELRERDPGHAAAIRIADGIRADGDPRLLRVLIVNLMENAWKFSRNIHSPIIEFGTSIMDGETVYHVRDNGVGFDMAHAGKLFGMFQRLHPCDEFTGTGIGLATVQRIVQRHKGRIWARGEVGRGATFYFTLRTGANPYLDHSPRDLRSIGER